jgi:nitroreductase
VQNLMLAARALGIGTTLTAVHRLGFEQEVRDVLGIPADVTTYALIPVGYPLGRWGQPSRLPFEEITYWDRWGEPPAPTATPGR